MGSPMSLGVVELLPSHFCASKRKIPGTCELDPGLWGSCCYFCWYTKMGIIETGSHRGCYYCTYVYVGTCTYIYIYIMHTDAYCMLLGLHCFAGSCWIYVFWSLWVRRSLVLIIVPLSKHINTIFCLAHKNPFLKYHNISTVWSDQQQKVMFWQWGLGV